MISLLWACVFGGIAIVSRGSSNSLVFVFTVLSIINFILLFVKIVDSIGVGFFVRLGMAILFGYLAIDTLNRVGGNNDLAVLFFGVLSMVFLVSLPVTIVRKRSESYGFGYYNSESQPEFQERFSTTGYKQIDQNGPNPVIINSSGTRTELVHKFGDHYEGSDGKDYEMI